MRKNVSYHDIVQLSCCISIALIACIHSVYLQYTVYWRPLLVLCGATADVEESLPLQVSEHVRSVSSTVGGSS